MRRPRLLNRIFVALLAMFVVWVAWQVLGNWQVRTGLSMTRSQIEAEQYATARDRLARLSALWPRNDDVAYLLGVCEAELGRPEEAVAAWEQVSASSSLGPLRAIAEGRTLVHSLGRLQDAERLYRDAASRGASARAIERGGRWPRCCSGRGDWTSFAGCSGRSDASARTATGLPHSANCGGSTRLSSRPRKSSRSSPRPR